MVKDFKQRVFTQRRIRRLRMAGFLLGRSFKALRQWSRKDVGFTMLPVLTLAALSLLFRKDLTAIWIAPELSFAAIVLFGSSVEHVAQMREDRVVRPYDLNFLSRFFLLLLVMSTMTFILGTTRTWFGGQGALDDQILSRAQKALILIALIGSFFLELLELAAKSEREDMPEWMSRYRYFKHLKGSLVSAKKNVRYSAILISQRGGERLAKGDPVMNSATWSKEIDHEIISELDCIGLHLQEIKESFIRQETQAKKSALG